MNHCRNTIRLIHESGGALDRETVEHCLKCPVCRRELLACLAAEDPAAPSVPAELDRKLLAYCRDGRMLKHRRTLRRSLAWMAGTAAAAAIFVLFFNSAGITGHDEEADFSAVNTEWDGSALFGKISDIGVELGKMEELLTNEMERAEI